MYRPRQLDGWHSHATLQRSLHIWTFCEYSSRASSWSWKNFMCNWSALLYPHAKRNQGHFCICIILAQNSSTPFHLRLGTATSHTTAQTKPESRNTDTTQERNQQNILISCRSYIHTCSLLPYEKFSSPILGHKMHMIMYACLAEKRVANIRAAALRLPFAYDTTQSKINISPSKNEIPSKKYA